MVMILFVKGIFVTEFLVFFNVQTVFLVLGRERKGRKEQQG